MNNTDIISNIYTAFGKGDIAGVFGAFAPHISWTEAEGSPYAGTFIGPDAILRDVFARLVGEWDGFASVPTQFVSEDDTVIVLGTLSGRYKATGKSFAAPFAHIWALENGKAVAFREVVDTVLMQRAVQ